MIKTGSLIALIAAITGFNIHVTAKYMAASREAAEPCPIIFAEDEFKGDIVEFDEYNIGYEPLIAAADANHKLLRQIYDFPGIDQPNLVTAQRSNLDDATIVVGIDVDGEACALPIKEMTLEDSHIVNLVIQQTAVSVTYCSLIDCVRVFGREGTSRIPFRLGGLNEEDEMVLLLNGVRYDQSSPRVPVPDYSFLRSTFGEWKRLHPATKVFQHGIGKRS